MQMKSRLVKVYPYEEVDISQFQKRFVPDEKAVQTALKRLSNKHIAWSEGGAAAAGDVVTCGMRSALAKFNRPEIRLTLGLGLFDRDVEQALLGAKAGDTLTLTKEGERVEIQVLAVKNKFVPELTDAMVQELALPGVNTLEDYRQYLIEAQKEEQFRRDFYKPCRHILETVLECSDIILKEADWQRDVDWQIHKAHTYCKEEGRVLEEMKDEDWNGKVPVKSYFEFVALAQKSAWESVALMVLGYAEAQKTGYAPSQQEYEEYLDDMVKQWGGNRQVYAEAGPFEYFESSTYGGVYYRILNEYLKKNLYLED